MRQRLKCQDWCSCVLSMTMKIQAKFTLLQCSYFVPVPPPPPPPPLIAEHTAINMKFQAD